MSSRETAEANLELVTQYPLNIISPKSHSFLNSCYANMENKIKGQGEQFVLIHAADAQSRDMKQGDTVRVFNDRGAFEGVAKITDDVNSGIVLVWRNLLEWVMARHFQII